MNLEQSVNILKQVVDLAVVKGGVFSNAKEVAIVNMAMETVDREFQNWKAHNEAIKDGPSMTSEKSIEPKKSSN